MRARPVWCLRVLGHMQEGVQVVVPPSLIPCAAFVAKPFDVKIAPNSLALANITQYQPNM